MPGSQPRLESAIAKHRYRNRQQPLAFRGMDAKEFPIL
jgi:hypothetical protein